MNTRPRASKSRPYVMKRRADRQADTRRRITEAAVELHSSVGPARTTLTMVAERAGVQRHTLYSHFPDERSLFRACSALSLERDPLPNAQAWRSIFDTGERLRSGLHEIYCWYERNESLTGCVLRDAQYHPLTRETADLAFGPSFAAFYEVLGEGLGVRARAMVRLAVSYFSWRSLVREGALAGREAADMMARTVIHAHDA